MTTACSGVGAEECVGAVEGTCLDALLLTDTAGDSADNFTHCLRAPAELPWSPPTQHDDQPVILFQDDLGSGAMETEAEDSEEENYGMARIREIMTQCRHAPTERPALSYIAMIGMAIQTSAERRLLLSDIYAWMLEHFAYFKSSDRSWRNSVRHNLSLNECFVKTGRADNGKGNFWMIHPANVDHFSQGDFRRRMARIKVRMSKTAAKTFPALPQTSAFSADTCALQNTHDVTGWVPMTSWTAPVTSLVQMFGAEAILSNKEIMNGQRNEAEYQNTCFSAAHTYFDTSCILPEEEYLKLSMSGNQSHSYMYPYM